MTRSTLPRARRTPGSRSSAGSGGATSRLRPRDPRERVDARDRVEEPRRRHARVDLARGSRERCTSSRSSLCPGTCSATAPADPDERQPRRGAEHEPAGGVEHAQRRQREQARADAPPGHRRRRSAGTPPAPPRPPSATSGVYADSPRRGAAARASRRRTRRRRSRRAEQRPATSPRRSPFSAVSAITASAIQSSVVTPQPTEGSAVRADARLHDARPWGRSSVG